MDQYEAKAELIDVPGDAGETSFSIFAVRYTLRDAGPDRPVTYVYDGGPGTASAFVHLGYWSPRIAAADGQLEDNPSSPLEFTDIVVLDPVGTGYSRAAGDARDYFGYTADIRAIARFIDLDLQRTGRWSSPKYVCGHSYGGQRTAGLLRRLQEGPQVAFEGAILLAPLIDGQLNDFAPADDLAFACALPALASAAWFHHKAGAGLEQAVFLEEVEGFATTAYAHALLLGGRLAATERAAVAEQVAAYTGLDLDYVTRANLRIHPRKFFKELLRKDGLGLSRQDMRCTGTDGDMNAEVSEFDPVLHQQFKTYATANVAAMAELGFASDAEYILYNRQAEPWDVSDVASGRHLDTADSLRLALARNLGLRLFTGTGLYDGSVSYFSAETSLARALQEPALAPRVTMRRYQGGHSFFADERARPVFHADLAEFYRGATRSAPAP